MGVNYPPLFERTQVHGLKVVTDEGLPSGLSKRAGRLVPIHGIRRLTLEGDAVVLGCRDCETVTDLDDEKPLGTMRRHRRDEHGVSKGGLTRAHRSAAEAEAAGQTALPVVMPVSSLSMTLHELLELASHVDAWEDVLANLENQLTTALEERDEAVRAKNKAERELSNTQKKIAKAMGLTIVSTTEG